MSQRLCALLALLCMLATYRDAASEPKQSEKRRAQALFAEGQSLYRAGDYPAAVEKFQAAYAAAPAPGFIFNIAQALRLEGNLPAALREYQRFVALAPTHRAAPEARAFIADLDARIRAEEAARAAAVPPPAPRPVVVYRPPPERRGRRALQVGGIATGVAGLGMLALGLKFGSDARGHRDVYNANEGPWTEELLAERGRADRAERRMVWLTVGGAALLATGATLTYFGWRSLPSEAGPPATGLGAEVTSDSAMLLFRTAFR